jgi:hypothetical protein
MFSSLFLGENLTLVQWIGVILTLTSIYLVSMRGSGQDSNRDDKSTSEITANTMLPASEQVVVSSVIPVLQQPVNELTIPE